MRYTLKIRYILFFAIIFTVSSAFSQQYSTKSRKAIKYFKKALSNYQNYDYQESLIYADKALKKDANFVEVYYLQSDIYEEMKLYDKKIFVLKRAIQINPNKSKTIYLTLCKTELREGKYKDAKKHLQDFRNTNPSNRYWAEMKDIELRCNFAIHAKAHPVPFEPKNLGKKVNTIYDDYFPMITADEQQIVFTVGVPKPGITKIRKQSDAQEDFFESRKRNGQWQLSQNMGKPVNTKGNEGAQSLSVDGTILFFTSCDNAIGENQHGKSFGSCDIFYSYKIGDRWTKPMNIGKPINTKYWESQPSFSSDGKTLYFTSNRPGGVGGIDIWSSTLQKNGYWSKPKNLGHKINTSGDEQSPFIHPDNETLYFSSSKLIGMGRSDLFISRKDSTGEWGEPKNLGYPINTHNQEFSLVVNAKGDKAYFAASYNDSYGGTDLYSFDLSKENQPNKVTYVKGKVYDAETKRPLPANFELINLDSKKTVVESSSDAKNGAFLLVLPVNNDFAMNVSKAGYLFHSENFSLKNLSDTVKYFQLDIPLNPIKKDEKIVLKNVFFETDSYQLKDKSFVELTKLFNFLKNNKFLNVEIGGHTDNTGNEKHNKKLSLNRAKSVYEFLIKKGIDKKRIHYKGYGSDKPIDSNKTLAGRSKNRRTEVKIQ